MKNRQRIWVAVLGLLWAATGIAQGNSSDQADVWSVIERQWNADERGDDDWIEDLLTDDFSGWNDSSPAPRNRTSTAMWDRVLDDVNKMRAHELYPLSIIVRGDVAVVHYLYSSANEDKDDGVKVENGRFTDVLVRTEDGWKFLAWHGGQDDD